MRIFFDTNVLASALGTRGFCAEVLELAAEEHDIVLGRPVLEELATVLRERFGVDETRIAKVLTSLARWPIHDVPGDPPADAPLDPPQLSDPEDVPVVLSALAAGAELLVTGDRALRAEAAGLPLQVVSPRECWELMRFEGSPQADEVHEPPPQPWRRS